MTRKVLIIIFLLLTIITVSIIINGTIFTLIFSVLTVGLLVVLTFIIGTIDYFRKTKYFKLPFALTICGILAIIVGSIGFKIKLENKKSNAEELVADIEQYYIRHGMFPDTLQSEWIEPSLGKYEYWTDSTNSRFSISYNYNGWQVASYRSDIREWRWSD